MADVMLTTSDNVWNPFTNFAEWYTLDEQRKYCTSGLIARYMSSSYDESDQEQRDDRAQAILRVLELFPFGPIGFENDANNNPIVYELIDEEGKRTKQTELETCMELLGLIQPV